MKSNEIRIGNYILDDDGFFSRISGFRPLEHLTRCDTEEGCVVLIDITREDGTISKGWGIESSECKPIPITSVWLEKLGFEKTDMPNLGVRCFYAIGNFVVEIIADNDNNNNVAIYYTSQHELIAFKKYIHELQNLFFALTGQELTIKQKIEK